jgi:hypothetical protein
LHRPTGLRKLHTKQKTKSKVSFVTVACLAIIAFGAISASEISSPQVANRKQGSPIPATTGAARHAKIIDEHRVFAPTRFFISLPEER